MKRILLGLWALVFAGVAFAASFQNGSFEVGALTADPCNTSLPIGSTAITGWTVIQGDVDYLTPSCWTPSQGTRSLDLVGSGSKGGIQQTFDTVFGQTYQVIFDLAGNPSMLFPPAVKNLSVTVDGTTYPPYAFDTTFQSPTNMGWIPQSLLFIAVGSSTTLSFVSDMTPSTFAGAAIDNVRVQAVSPIINAWTDSTAAGNVHSGSSTTYPALPQVCGGAGSTWSAINTLSYPLTIASNGTQGTVVASYNVPQGNSTSGICGSWTATATATSSGDVNVLWDYRGDHSSFDTTVDLQAFVIRGASVVQSDYVVSSLSGTKFQNAGQYTFHVQPGDVYGFTMTGSNFDFADALRGTLTAVVVQPPLVPPPAPWVGSVNSSTYTSTINVPRDGTATNGRAVFTYSAGLPPGPGPTYPNPSGSGSWTFSTTANAAGTFVVPYSYTGFHAFFNVSVGLVAFVTHDGVTTTSTLVNDSGAVCCTPPSGGFAYTGSYAFAVAAGDTYGFTMTGSNSDADGRLFGTLSLPPPAATTTALVSSVNPSTFGGNIDFSATVAGSSPTGTVSFTDGGTAIPACTAVPLPAGGIATCSVSGLTAGTHSIVATYNGDYDNASSLSNVVSQVVNAPAITTPSAPSIGTASALAGSLTATVTWSAPATNGGSPITGYTITSNPGGLTGSAAAGATSGTVSGLQFGQGYTFTVTATNTVGISPSSGPSNIVTPLTFAPTLISAIEDAGGTFATVIGRVDGTLTGVSVQPLVVATCNNGVAGFGPIPVGPAVAPNSDGYVIATPSAVARGQFVALQLVQSGTPISGVSGCLASLGNNEFWTTAALVGPDSPAAGSTSVNDFIDAAGKARWYKFKIAPGQRISVSLTGLPADYDLAVFKDIGAAFLAQLVPADSAALTKLSAEYAPSTFSPSTFSPSTFSPSTFSPSTFSPDAFAPSTFSPSTFSPSTFSPSTFSPSTFSPSTFSPSTFSPSTFSPSTFSPSTFSPSTFSPSTFSPDIIATAFSSAQTRSLIGVSATAGTVNESAVVDSWNNGGYFYARVTGRNGAFSTSGPFQIAVTKSASSCASVTDTTLTPRGAAAANGIVTVILTDTSSFSNYPGADVALMSNDLAALASSTNGVVVDVAGDNRVAALKAQALAHSDCPFAMNLVAEEIKGIVDSYRQNNPGMRFVAIAGGDDVIPFFRYPDESMLGPESGYVPPVTGASDASLRGNYVLSQDTYGSKTRVSLRVSDFPVPGLAVGRLVKTPTEIAGMVEVALPKLVTVNGALQPMSSLVTGYDFLADVAGSIATELQSGTGRTSDQLLTANGVSPSDTRSFASGGPWTAVDLHTVLLDSGHHDIVFLAGHFSANSALAADFATNLITSDLAASKTDFTNTIIFSAGCHSGYDIVNRDALPTTFTLDWAQAFAQKRATLIAGTGYQYGDTDFTEYSERLYLNFARELRVGTGAVAIGEALVKAKVDYLAATPDIRGIHTKALLEATLYGLPMLGVNMPAGRPGPTAGAFPPAITPGPPTSLGLRTASLSLSPSVTPQHTQLTGDNSMIAGPLTTWLQGPDGVVSNPSEPVLPLSVVNATPTDDTIVLRGVGFRGGSYSDSRIVPLTGAPATEIRGVHVPFAAPNFFPNRTWTVNYFGALAGNGATSLLVTPAQHRGADVDGAGILHSTLRQFSALDLRLYYSSNRSQASLSDAPSIVAVDAQQGAGGEVVFTARVTGDPAAAIYQVWVVFTDGGGTWVPVDLAQCDPTALPAFCGLTADSQIWKGTANLSSSAIQYVVQAANGMGLVTFDDNRGAYYAFNGASFSSTTQQAAAAAPTSLALESAPASAAYGDSVSVTARLTSGGSPVAGGLVNLNIGGFGNSGITDGNGRVTLKATVSSAPGSGIPIAASYAGSGTDLLPSSAATSFSVTKASVTLTPLASPTVGVNVTAPVVIGGTTTQQPLAGQSVSFVFTSAAFAQTVVVNTDTSGNATVPTAGLAPGSYSVTASFLPASVAAEDTYYAGATRSLAGFTMNAQLLTFTALPTSPITYAPPGTFGVIATLTGQNAGKPIVITSATPDVCIVSGSPGTPQASFTATVVSAGTDCKLNADVAGSSTFAAAHVAATITILKSTQTITAAPSTLTFQQSSLLATSTNAPASQTITYTVSGNCSLNGNTLTSTSGTGTCTIGASAPGTSLYNAYSNATFATIALQKASQQIAFPTVSPAPTFVASGTGTFQVSASAPGGTVVFTVPNTTSVCSVSGTSVTMKSAGLCTIAANQPGNVDFSPAPQVSQSVSIGKASQTIAFAGPGDRAFGTSPFALQATATSGLPVAFAASPTGVCTLQADGITVNLVAPGQCTITASQAGNGNFNPAAPSVIGTFKVYLAGMVSLGTATISSGAMVDSYDSIGTYAATKGAAADLVTNGVITLSAAKVYGNVLSATDQIVVAGNTLITGDVTADKAITVSSSTVNGKVTPNHPLHAIVVPPVAACSPYTSAGSWISGSHVYDAAHGNLTVSGNSTATLAGGAYCLNSITISGGATVNVNGPVKITMNGSFTASGSGTAVNMTQPPSSLQLSLTGGGVTISGATAASLAVYAPASSGTISSGATVYGALLAKTVTVSGTNTSMHYDAELLRVWGPMLGL